MRVKQERLNLPFDERTDVTLRATDLTAGLVRIWSTKDLTDQITGRPDDPSRAPGDVHARDPGGVQSHFLLRAYFWP